MRSVKLPSLHSSIKPVTCYASTGSKESSLGYSLHVLVCLEEICGNSCHWSLHPMIIIIIQTSYSSPETPWVAVFIRAEEDQDGSGLGKESGGSLPHGEHRGWEVHICLKTFSWAPRRGWCWKPCQGIFLYTKKTRGRKGAGWWCTNQRRKAGYQHCYVHEKQLHKLNSNLKNEHFWNQLPFNPCWTAPSELSPPFSRSVKCGFTSSLGVILWQHSQLL